MHFKKFRPFTVMCITILMLMLSSTIVWAAIVSQGPLNTKYDFYWIGDERIKFKAQMVTTTDTSQLNNIVKGTKDQQGTHIWDDEWYYVTLPDNRAKYWLVSWYNLDYNEYGWLLIINTPSTWYYKVNGSDSWYKVGGNGQQVKRTWWSNGERIDIDVYNPPNKDGWTGNDIWYSFGF